MGTMTIRDFDEDLQAKLRVRAARHGVSMEDEAYAIVRDVLLEDADAHAVGTLLAPSEGKWQLKASFEDLMKLSIKPDRAFDQKAISDELYAYLDEA